MKELNDIDKLLHSSLAGYNPVPEMKSKERFLDSASTLWSGIGKSYFNWKALLLTVVLLSSVTVGIYYFLRPGTQESSQDPIATSQVIPNNIKPAVARETAVYSSTSHNKDNELNAESIKVVDTPAKIPLNKNETDSFETEIKTHNHAEEPLKEVIENSVKVSADNDHNLYFISAIPSRDISYLRSVTIHSDQPIVSNHLTETLPAPEPQYTNTSSVKQQKSLQMAYSLYYRPEFVFNIIDNNKLVNNFGLDVHFKLFNDRYIIRTGIGTSLSKGYNEYAVEYNAYLGSYEGIDSVTFSWDDKHYHLVPTYHMSEREVFDTAVQTEISQVYKRYTYLQIPLILGYDFITNKKYALGFRLGPTFSALLSSETLSDNFDPGKDKIVQINQISPDRVQTNWLMMVGFNISIYSKKKLFYQLEPQFSYYFNSVYQKYDASNPPYSVGLRIAIGIK